MFFNHNTWYTGLIYYSFYDSKVMPLSSVSNVYLKMLLKRFLQFYTTIFLYIVSHENFFNNMLLHVLVFVFQLFLSYVTKLEWWTCVSSSCHIVKLGLFMLNLLCLFYVLYLKPCILGLKLNSVFLKEPPSW